MRRGDPGLWKVDADYGSIGRAWVARLYFNALHFGAEDLAGPSADQFHVQVAIRLHAVDANHVIGAEEPQTLVGGFAENGSNGACRGGPIYGCRSPSSRRPLRGRPRQPVGKRPGPGSSSEAYEPAGHDDPDFDGFAADPQPVMLGPRRSMNTFKARGRDRHGRRGRFERPAR
jgi:hypothetical protein